ncbi:AraC family transcriptional regulator [Desulfosporosinus sp. PR]|uniref:AraC family transcriptional regulator n=1 Tax=Candidatus Desulfosporosinus nitrosoreducens TaxID=3401928 RepID=UPI0027F5BAC8|nr:AraC family transcriptional regulator [Desulfosporosinus sp. PR]MDQ7095701.1 AraC family transcriptional regulator [Desulfosporosinus sp. PR]
MIPKPISVLSNRQEMTEHVVSGFTMAGYRTVFSKSTYDYVDWHWHTEFQFCIVTTGNVIFPVGEKKYIVKSGDGIFINSQSVHMARAHQCEEASYFCVDFHPNLICSDQSSELYCSHVLPALANAGLSAISLSSSDSRHHLILKSLQQIQSQFINKEPGFELNVVIGILEMWKNMVLILPKCDIQQSNRGDNRLKQIFLFIQEFYDEPLTLERIAEYVHLSRSECCRYFRKITGQTLFAYISQYRIDKSIDLLLRTDRRVSEIAVAVGFTSQSYYTECFRKIKNMTPKEFRLRRQSIQ